MLMHIGSCFRHDPFSAVFFYLAGHILLPLRVILLEAYMLIILHVNDIHESLYHRGHP